MVVSKYSDFAVVRTSEKTYLSLDVFGLVLVVVGFHAEVKLLLEVLLRVFG